MEITEVTISLREEDKLKGFANITFDNQFVVRGLKIIQGLKGFFIAMPSRKRNDGTFRDIAHPITAGFRDMMEKVVLDKYWEVVKQVPETSTVEAAEDYF